jgi:GH25 family lysozyme M1 (1,4-beta-N-acetylmuramidase)
MTLKGIDISSYQSDIDLSRVNADFVIVKVTGGTWYENPY